MRNLLVFISGAIQDLQLYLLKMIRLGKLYIFVAVFLMASLCVQTQTNIGYACDVSNCLACSSYNFCGACQPNFLLNINSTTGMTYCTPVACDVENCTYCIAPGQCEQCIANNHLTFEGTCVHNTIFTRPANCNMTGCLTCKTQSDTYCQICQYGFTLNNGQCIQDVNSPDNSCQVSFNPAMCQVCTNPLQNMITPTYQCVPIPNITCNVAGCDYCSSNNTCQQCLQNYKNNEGTCTAQLCNITGCQFCETQTICLECDGLYQLTNGTCVPFAYGCNVENCLFCEAVDQCGRCAPGYYDTKIFSHRFQAQISYCSNDFQNFVDDVLVLQNCATVGVLREYGIMDTYISQGCVQCNENFYNVGGFCVANITISQNQCNVENCQWCSAPNYCGQCSEGYTVFQNTGGVCTKNYSPIPECQIIGVNQFDCAVCNPGFTLNSDLQECIPVKGEITCQVPGCIKCLEDGVCNQCGPNLQLKKHLLGHMFCESTLPCQQIPNCEVCQPTQISQIVKCTACAEGFVLSSNDFKCTAVNCTQLFGSGCTACNTMMCTSCSEGTSNDNSLACTSVASHNMLGCKQYENDNVNTCADCSLGYILAGGQCYRYPCEINNCIYCFRSQVCIVCQAGYNLIDGVCTIYQDNSCSEGCTTCTETPGEEGQPSTYTCTACINGLKLYNGTCVCDIQNCVQCQADAFCTLCASPFIPQVIQGGACVQRPNEYIKCTVSNCAQCFGINQCSYCNPGYSLNGAGDTCVINPCNSNSTNCQLCDQTNSICFQCRPGYVPSDLFSQNCFAIPSDYSCQIQGCSICSMNDSNTCEICHMGLDLVIKEGQTECQQVDCFDNCLLCFSKNSCVACYPNFYLTTDADSCQYMLNGPPQTCSSIDNCLQCSANTTILNIVKITCLACRPGFMPSANGQSCVSQQCNAQNCAVCMPTGSGQDQCILCEQGYFINTYLECVAYNSAPATVTCEGIYNCLYCSGNNTCGLCLNGWSQTYNQRVEQLYFQYMSEETPLANATPKAAIQICVTQNYCVNSNCTLCTSPSHCLQCAKGTTLMLNSTGNNTCGTGCGVSSCQVCYNQTTCLFCSSGFSINSQWNQCGCAANGSQYILSVMNDTEQYNLYKQNCQPSLCTVENCALCELPPASEGLPENPPTCQECLPTFTKITNEDGTVTCQCLNQVYSNPQLQYNQCILCDVEYCISCSADNFCAQCMDSFQNIDGNCQCYEDFIIVKLNGTGQDPGDLYQCQCPGDLVPINDGQNCACADTYNRTGPSTCVCPTNTYQENSTCLACGVQFCQQCSGPGVCTTCFNSFELINGSNGTKLCACPFGATLNAVAKSCYSCNIQNCAQCISNNTCSKCVGNFLVNTTAANQTVCICPLGMSINENNNNCVCPTGTFYFPTNTGTQKTQNQCQNCTIPNCGVCFNSTLCSTCDAPFVSGGNNNGCTCPTSFVQQNNTCVCPDDTVLFNGVCYSCNVPNCKSCMSNNTCITCLSTFVLSTDNNTCLCPSNQQVVNGSCGCPVGQTLYQGTCYNCNITNCAVCSSNNVCNSCSGELIVLNASTTSDGTMIGSCGCPNTFEQLQLQCDCPIGTYESISQQEGVLPTCVACNSSIDYCLTCTSPDICLLCQDTFTSVQYPREEGNQTVTVLGCGCPPTYELFDQNTTEPFCGCPNDTILYNDQVCVLCLVEFCSYCTSANICGQCVSGFIPREHFNQQTNVTSITCTCSNSYVIDTESQTCVCPLGTSQYEGTCISCNVKNCVTCNKNNSCLTCNNTFDRVGQDGQVIGPQTIVSCECPLTKVINEETGLCECPLGTYFNTTSDKCQNCDIYQCEACQEAPEIGDTNSSIPTCTVCIFPYSLISPANKQPFCACDLPFVATGEDSCGCPVGSTLENFTCNVQYCASYSDEGVCSGCQSNFVLDPNNFTCSCPDTYIIATVFNVTTNTTNPTCQCPQGYTVSSSDQKCYQCNVSHCSQCGVMNNNCVTCTAPFIITSASSGNLNTCACPANSNYFSDPTNDLCLQCNMNVCQACSDDNICSSCKATYVFNSTSQTCECPSNSTQFINTTTNSYTCVFCNINNCASCSSTNQCDTCMTGYDLIEGSNYCMQCNIANCTKCSLDNVCAECSPGLEVSAQGNTCLTCSVNNCLLCSSVGLCAVCNTGFQLVAGATSNGGQCVQCSGIAGCASCSSNNICSRCFAGYNLDTLSNTCTVCSYPCKTCVAPSSGNSGVNVCASCSYPYSSTPDSNGNCFTCAIPNCLACQSTSLSTCTQCATGYEISTDNITLGQCISVCTDPVCTSCVAGSPSTCTACATGFIVSQGSCISCKNTPQCLQCATSNPYTCQTCSAGYYMNVTNTTDNTGNCEACPNNCETCAITGSAFTIQCVTFKASTSQFLIHVGGQTLPAICNAGCQTCETEQPSNCIVCSPGFALNTQDYNCWPCPQTCQECVVSSFNETTNTPTFSCTSCYSNAFLSSTSGECTTCNASRNCLTCDSNNLNTCTSCPNGYNLNTTTNICQPGCPSNCLTCTTGSTCKVCLSGFSLSSDGSCVPCLSSCRECASSAPGTCLSCGFGSYLNPETSTCQDCSTQYCQSCTYVPNSSSNTTSRCNSCLPGYTLTANFTCIANCVPPCATCSSTSSTSCTSCLAGYTFSQSISTCAPQTKCPGGCNICPLGYTVNSDQVCVQCTNSKCSRCLATNTSACTTCIDGLYLSASGTCQACPSSCATCSSATNCLTCQPGYTILEQPTTNAAKTCIACQSPCMQCIGNAATCTSCQSGFYLNGWKCVSNFNYQFQMVLGVDLPVFYQNYQNFLQSLANTITKGANINTISVNSIKQGSTIVDAQVITNANSGSNEADQQFTALEQATSKGQTIAGMNIQSSQLSVNGGTAVPDDNSSSPNLGLILGICIPVGVILIGLIVYLCFRRRKFRHPPNVTGMDETGRGAREEFQLK